MYGVVIPGRWQRRSAEPLSYAESYVSGWLTARFAAADASPLGGDALRTVVPVDERPARRSEVDAVGRPDRAGRRRA